MHDARALRSRLAEPARLAVVAGTALLVVASTACTGDDDPDGTATADSIGPGATQDLFGPEGPASGEPVKLGQVTEGSTPVLDTTDEVRAGRATVTWLNAHRGGIGGRPIELVTCEMKADPATASDCANRMVEEGVVAVTLPHSAVGGSLWQPLHDAGIPLVMLEGFGEDLLSDERSTFLMVNPVATFFGLPVALAEAEGADKVAFVVIDVPQAIELLEADDGATMERAGLDYEIVQVPLGTPDMTSQMQDVVDSGAGVVHVLGNDAFCIAAFQGLRAVAYDGAVSGVAQCFTDATREALGADLEGIAVQATLAEGATDDPTYQLYQAVMEEYGDDVEEVEGPYALSGFAAVATVAAAVEGIDGDVTAASTAEAIRTMPETELPAGGGVTFRCGGSASAAQPAVCTNQWLRTELDADGRATSYTVEDSSEVLG
jgi:branched-chain amino acid transport system substrate-binding protein